MAFIPGGHSIATNSFSASEQALIQQAIDLLARGDRQSNIDDPATHSGSAMPQPGEFNVELANPAAINQLPTGFRAGFLLPGAGNGELIGNGGRDLLAASAASWALRDDRCRPRRRR